tara:strand:- start:3934 stop:4554 length:621 start_codon:yes stop_codon:yes gene_type:complete
MTIKEIQNRTGTLSNPSKMPCHGYSIPAIHCKIGSILAKRKGTVCSNCYALKGRYVFPNVQAAMEKRFDAVMNSPTWVEDMTELIGRKEKSGYFRWHDSGDLQSVEHLEKICQIARNLPHIQFWLPTREYKTVQNYSGIIPDNLIIRLSAHKVNVAPPISLAEKLLVETSAVSTEEYNCPAPDQGNSCGDCRKCWTKGETVTYKEH